METNFLAPDESCWMDGMAQPDFLCEDRAPIKDMHRVQTS